MSEMRPVANILGHVVHVVLLYIPPAKNPLFHNFSVTTCINLCTKLFRVFTDQSRYINKLSLLLLYTRGALWHTDVQHVQHVQHVSLVTS
jgi:hypothetical protein